MGIMGFFGQVVKGTNRKIDNYSFEYIKDDLDSPYIAQEFDKIFDNTKWVLWGSEYLSWYTFDNRRENSGSVEFDAQFAMKAESGENIYMWVLDHDNKLVIITSKFGESLQVQYFRNEEMIFSANMNLSKT